MRNSGFPLLGEGMLGSVWWGCYPAPTDDGVPVLFLRGINVKWVAASFYLDRTSAWCCWVLSSVGSKEK